MTQRGSVMKGLISTLISMTIRPPESLAWKIPPSKIRILQSKICFKFTKTPGYALQKHLFQIRKTVRTAQDSPLTTVRWNVFLEFVRTQTIPSTTSRQIDANSVQAEQPSMTKFKSASQ